MLKGCLYSCYCDKKCASFWVVSPKFMRVFGYKSVVLSDSHWPRTPDHTPCSRRFAVSIYVVDLVGNGCDVGFHEVLAMFDCPNFINVRFHKEKCCLIWGTWKANLILLRHSLQSTSSLRYLRITVTYSNYIQKKVLSSEPWSRIVLYFTDVWEEYTVYIFRVEDYCE
jgi:hypothetical protein